MLEIAGLTKIFGKAATEPAVDNFSMTVNDGEIVGLLGSSGCGKTTILRSVAGFVTPTCGTISMAGDEIQHLRPALRNVAMAFEGYALYPPLRVRENIAFALKRWRRSESEVAATVADIATMLAIDGILDLYPAAISAGQQQRTSLARALIRRASITLLDEPMSQLEPQLRALLRARIKEYLSHHQLTAIFVTHDQSEAMALADRIAVMEKGIMQQYDTPDEIRERPANLFVASFIGEPPMNLIEAVFLEDGATVAIELRKEGRKAMALGYSLSYSLSDLRMEAGCLQNAAYLGIRPHRIEFGGEGGLRAHVVASKWLGDQTHVVLDLGGIKLVAASPDKNLGLASGDDIVIKLPSEALIFFDREHGTAIARRARN